MTRINKLLLSVCAILALGAMSSCGWFVEGYSTDPNNPVDVPEKLILPSAQVSTTMFHGMDMAWYSSVFLQMQCGTARQMFSASQYDVISGDMSNPWQGAYVDALEDLKQLQDKATVSGNVHYSAAAKVLTAMVLGTLTDGFGNIPYAEALAGDQGSITPAFQTQEEIYTTIQTLLDEAITEFGQESPVSPSSEDLIYGGDVDAWVRAANALKARNYIHLKNVDASAAANALNALDNGFVSNADDMSMPFGTADPANANPWYQFNAQRGDLTMGTYFIELLEGLNDPRLPIYASPDASGGFSGSGPTTPDPSASYLGEFFGGLGNPEAPVALITYMESEFIRAEALLATGGPDAAIHEAFVNGITASCERVGVADTTAAQYIASVDPGAGNVTLEDVMTQKYIAMFTQFECWTDVRRTGLPAIPPFSGTEIPARYPYPQSELDLNSANVPGNPTLFEKLWWDQ